jgi:hypothetical protein
VREPAASPTPGGPRSPPRRLQQGVGFREPLTWDILQALALVDGIAGDGGEFWLVRLLPAPLLAPLLALAAGSWHGCGRWLWLLQGVACLPRPGCAPGAWPAARGPWA